jgi:SAM-dependent methyltransferase
VKQCPNCNGILNEWVCNVCKWEPPVIDGFISFEHSLARDHDDFFPDEVHEILWKTETGSFWFNSRNRLLNWAMKRYFPEAKELLEIGCGTGFVLHNFAKEFPEMHLTGAELFISGLTFARSRVPSASFVQMDARRIPYRDEFDVIGIFDVLEHIDEDEKVLGELYKAVKPGGGCIITVPQHKWLWSASDEVGFHKRRYTGTELKEKVEHAGFRIIRLTSFMCMVLPFLILSRIRYRLTRQQITYNTTIKELKLPGPLDDVFAKLCDIERAVLSRKSLPVGGSLLCVAGKGQIMG